MDRRNFVCIPCRLSVRAQRGSKPPCSACHKPMVQWTYRPKKSDVKTWRAMSLPHPKIKATVRQARYWRSSTLLGDTFSKYFV